MTKLARDLRIDRLESRVLLSASNPQWDVHHTPRLQLGDAPLNSPTDQVGLIWQTQDGGTGTNDWFEVDYREVGSPAWIDAGTPIETDLGENTRINHEIEIQGLSYDTTYEYRVEHHSDSDLLATYQDTFDTRLAAGASGAFTFTAYGDSADIKGKGLAGWKQVAAHNQDLAPDFTILLGDNAGNHGTYDELDSRYDTFYSPENVEFVAGVVEYTSVGNHDDVVTHAPMYMLPQVAGLPDAESNYSFDYGNTHFMVIDAQYRTTAHPVEWDAIMTWLEADLAASTADWNILITHYPLASRQVHVHDHPGRPYYDEIVSLPGLDLVLTGHAHNYQRSYPLRETGVGPVQSEPALPTEQATWYDPVDDNYYPKGAGVTQVIAGTGGLEIDRPGLPIGSPVDYVAVGYTLEEGLEYGVLEITIDGDTLTSSFVDINGTVQDSFTIGPGTIVESPAVEAAAFNQVATLTAGQDTFISSANPDTEYSTGTGGQFPQPRNAWRWDNSDTINHTLVKFDDIPEGVVVSSATLRYRGAGPPQCCPTAAGGPADIFEMLDPWVDTNTWNDLSGAPNHGARISQVSPADFGYVDIDLTESVQRISDGVIDNNGWLLKSIGKDAGAMNSMESPTPPELIIEYYRPGDANGDDVVDGADANIISANFLLMGENLTLGDGDLNQDGKVDGTDANILSANFDPPAPAQPQRGAFPALSDFELIALRFGEVLEDDETSHLDLNGDGVIDGLDVNILGSLL